MPSLPALTLWPGWAMAVLVQLLWAVKVRLPAAFPVERGATTALWVELTAFRANAPAKPTFLAPAPEVAWELNAFLAWEVGSWAATVIVLPRTLALPLMSARLPALPWSRAIATPTPNVLPSEPVVPVVREASAVADEGVADAAVTCSVPVAATAPVEVMEASVWRVFGSVRAKAPARPRPPVEELLFCRACWLFELFWVAPPCVDLAVLL